MCQEREELKNVEQSDDDSIGSVPKEFLKKDTTFKMGTKFQIGFLHSAYRGDFKFFQILLTFRSQSVTPDGLGVCVIRGKSRVC